MYVNMIIARYKAISLLIFGSFEGGARVQDPNCFMWIYLCMFLACKLEYLLLLTVFQWLLTRNNSSFKFHYIHYLHLLLRRIVETIQFHSKAILRERILTWWRCQLMKRIHGFVCTDNFAPNNLDVIFHFLILTFLNNHIKYGWAFLFQLI